jgi:hypothetical protein
MDREEWWRQRNPQIRARVSLVHPNRGARLNLEITKNDKNKTKSAAVAICLLKEIYVRSGPKGSD